ncbi:MAG: hypothetical protein Q9170_007634 [Blastenia crenularia]
MPSKGPRRYTGPVLVPWVYDLGLWLFTLAIDIFFREVYPRGAWKIPKRGPVIIVAAPHANQFVDSLLLMRIFKGHANRRISFLIAEKSMREPYIGPLAAAMGALPVVRAMDQVRPGIGQIYLPNADDAPTTVRAKEVDFRSPQFMIGGSIILPKTGTEAPEQQQIAEIMGSDELRLKKPFESAKAGHPLSSTLGTGTSYKLAPHIDQSEMFEAVYDDLTHEGCIGIFPEGGSHDRPSLLPLKAGVAMIALGSLAHDPDSKLTILPCGMNYFNPNKFRSRAVIEFGNPVQVRADQIEAYNAGGSSKRDAVGSLLLTIEQALAAVTQQAPDHETLMLIQATRRLYKPLRMKLPLPLVIELNRRLLTGYTQYKNDPQVIQLKDSVAAYNRQLRALGVKDHQVEWGDIQQRSRWVILGTLAYRVMELLALCVGVLPSLALFWPVFVITKIISVQKQRKALAGSVVKLQGRDVVGTWKILVAMGLAPALYTWYTAIVSIWLHYCRHDGHYSRIVPWWMNATVYVPRSLPIWVFAPFFFGLMIAVTFAGLRMGEISVDIFKSLPPLFVALNPGSSDSLVKLRAQRQALSTRVVDAINTFGPEIFPDFEYENLYSEDFAFDGAYESELKSMPNSGASTPRHRRSRSRSSSKGPDSLRSSGVLKALTAMSKEDIVGSGSEPSSKHDGQLRARHRSEMQDTTSSNALIDK